MQDPVYKTVVAAKIGLLFSHPEAVHAMAALRPVKISQSKGHAVVANFHLRSARIWRIATTVLRIQHASPKTSANWCAAPATF